MNNLQNINLQDLQRRFYERPSAQDAVIWLAVNKTNTAFVDRVLRSHFEEPVTDPQEIKVRDAFDALLDFYSQLEIASLSDFIAEKSALLYHEQAKDILENPLVIKYYCERYPLLLPQLFLARTKGKFSIRYPAKAANAIPIYLEMLEVCRSFYEDADVQLFLDCLDDYILWGDEDNPIISIDLVIESIGNPSDYIKRLLRPLNERERLDNALQGFIKFLNFCQNFYNLLERSAEFPILQSAMWHSQSYWFRTLRDQTDISQTMDAAIALFSRWETILEPGNGSFEETQEAIAKLRLILSELFSDKYNCALLKTAQEQGITVFGFN